MNELFEFFIMPIVHGAMFTLIAAFMAAPLALIMLLVDLTVGKRMAPRFRCLLWMLVVVRLVMPVAPESSLSVHNLWKFNSPEEPSYANSVISFPPEASSAPAPDTYQTVGEFMSSPGVFSAMSAPTALPVGVPWEEIVLYGLSLCWLLGVVVMLLRAIIASLRFARRLNSIPRVVDQHVEKMLQRVCDELDVGYHPHVKYVPDLPAPALFGLFRPTLCLPEETRSSLNNDQLRMIMIHEVMHLRRRDGILSWLFTVVQAVHWFNPIARFALGRVANYREQACDAAVRRLTLPEERHTYTDLLLQFASQPRTASLGLVGLWFAQPTRGLTDRIRVFSSGKNSQTSFPRFAAGAIVGLLAMVGLTDAASTNLKSEPSPPRIFSIDGGLAWQAMIDQAQEDLSDSEKGPIEERVYDITQPLKKMSEINAIKEARRNLLGFLKSPMAKALLVRQSEKHPNQLNVTMTQQEHERFTNILNGISRSGLWQVTVEMQTFRTKHLETIRGIDWQDAVKFALPALSSTSTWPQDTKTEGDQGLSLSMESVSYEYAPYLAVILDQKKMRQITEQSYHDPETTLLGAPKVTAFNGQIASSSLEAFRPFVVRVQYTRGELGVAAQPDIAVLPEGTKIDVRPLVIDKNALDLQCRLTVSHIDGVSEAKLPGQDIVVQIPRVWRKTIVARCRLKPGQTLLIAPTTGKLKGEDRDLLYYAITPQWFLDPIITVAEENSVKQEK